MDFKNKSVMIFGMGISGKGVAHLLSDEECALTLYDSNEQLDDNELLGELNLLGKANVKKGDLVSKDFKGIDILILSPGISINAPYVEMAKEEGVHVIGEVEAAYLVKKGRLAAITGTNGKTTTTALTGKIMQAHFDDVYVVGNIGKSFASVAKNTKDESVIVAEISSFQLESIYDFHPEVSAVLNITPDHLDRHKTFENYAKTKMLIAKNQSKNEKCVINYDDEYLRTLAKDINPDVFYFSYLSKLDKGIYLDGDDIVYNDGTKVQKIINRYDMNLLGKHNVENVMAACAIGILFGVDIETICNIVKEFKAVEHRIEYVTTKGGVKYYNDSKGTNTDAATRAVEAMTSKTVIIAGGYDKGADFTDWINSFDGKIKDMVLIGQTAQKIKETAMKCGFENIHMCDNLQEAVKKAASLANEGECVLLSPACASWGQFKNYEQRGELFKQFVLEL